MIFCFTSRNQNNGKLHKEPTNRLCCAKNELTIGLVYAEKMIDTQMSWLHILVKDRGSTFIVILKDFLARQIVLLFIMGRQHLLKNGKCYSLLYIDCPNVLRNAVRINLIFWFNRFLVTVSVIHTCLAPLSTTILCQPEPSQEAF